MFPDHSAPCRARPRSGSQIHTTPDRTEASRLGPGTGDHLQKVVRPLGKVTIDNFSEVPDSVRDYRAGQLVELSGPGQISQIV